MCQCHCEANPLGDVTKDSVIRGNLCVARFVLLVLVAYARGCIWAVEQPGSSLMPNHPRMQHLLHLSVRGIMPANVMQRLWMGGFGHWSAKPTKIWGDASGT